MPNELNPSSGVIAEEVRAEMARQSITTKDLADRIGVPISTMRRSVKGFRPFTVTELFAVAEELGVSITKLVERAEHAA